MFDESKIQYLKPYEQLYEHVAHIIKYMKWKEWMTAAKYCRDALAEMVEQIYQCYSYRVEGGTLWSKCQILNSAKIISPQSMTNYDAIREFGNAAAHPEDIKYKSYAFNKDTLVKIVSLLLEETIIFVESYTVNLVENGKQRIRQAYDQLSGKNANGKKSGQQSLPPVIVRMVGIAYITFGLVFMLGGLTATGNGFVIGIPFVVFSGVIVVIGFYGLITGDEKVFKELR